MSHRVYAQMYWETKWGPKQVLTGLNGDDTGHKDMGPFVVLGQQGEG